MIMLAEITRAGKVESSHAGSIVVAGTSGNVIASAGDTETFAYFRSSAKPFQSVPLVESGAADAFGFDDKELALACASHNATREHRSIVRTMLTKVGLNETDLRCGISPPADEREAARITLGLRKPDQIWCECSGEHAGMLATCAHLGYPLDSYTAPDHPLQQRVQSIISAVLQRDPAMITIATDGCSLPTFGAPLHAFATAYATLGHPQRAAPSTDVGLADSIDRLRNAMLAHPALITGKGELDTDLMHYSHGRVVAKLGAEGLLCMAIPERGWGIAIKSADGLPRVLGPAAISALEQLDLLDRPTLATLRDRHCGPIETFRGEPVGEIRPVFELSPRSPS